MIQVMWGRLFFFGLVGMCVSVSVVCACVMCACYVKCVCICCEVCVCAYVCVGSMCVCM